jgi:branched-chain amino acid transport system ATP-binding protein
VLEIEDLRVTFGGVAALAGVGLRLGATEVVGVVGANGSGKSTLLNALTGAVAATGRLRLEGRDLAGLASDRVARAGVARAFQTARAFRHMSVLDNARPAHPVAADVAPAEVWLARVGLAERARDLAGDLDQFALRRLELARTLAAGPRLILLDEPTSGLTPNESEAMVALLRQWAVGRVAMLVVEHRMDVVRELCPRTVVLDLGRILADGPTGDVLALPAVAAAYFGRETIATCRSR